MPNRLPRTLYFVKVLPGGRPLKYREAGGGKFTQKEPAQKRLDYLRRTGVACELYEASVEWRCIDRQPPPQKETLF